MIKNIRNFSIIAHIDHGKSTLSDRFIQYCKGLEEREMQDQVLDSLDTERKRGITIKAQSVSLQFNSNDGNTYQLNFIDTPGHVDFSYEVSRSLASCEGALLVVDARSGIQAQTLANCKIALQENLKIIPVINKIDLPGADPDKVRDNIKNILGIDVSCAVECSAKKNIGIQQVLEKVVEVIPHPVIKQSSFKGRIIDSWFDIYAGVITLIRIYSGQVTLGDTLQILSTKNIYKVEEVGIFTPRKTPYKSLQAGQVGYLIMGIRDISAVLIGDTIINAKDLSTQVEPIGGFQKSIPTVYASFFPYTNDEFEKLRRSLDKLSLNDSSFEYLPENSASLGYGFRCGFLGLLHMEVIQERLSAEYDLDLIVTAPSVTYLATDTKGVVHTIKNIQDLPCNKISFLSEPMAEINIIMPSEYIGQIMNLCQEKRGEQILFEYIGNEVNIVYSMPLIEVINNFADKLKSITHGFGSFSYSLSGYKHSQLSVLEIKLNDEIYSPFSQILHKTKIKQVARDFVQKIVDNLPREQFEIRVQACIGSKIIASGRVRPFRKDVTAKCYGGDFRRKKKLLEKQKEGKKNMRSKGKVKILSKIASLIIK